MKDLCDFIKKKHHKVNELYHQQGNSQISDTTMKLCSSHFVMLCYVINDL